MAIGPEFNCCRYTVSFNLAAIVTCGFTLLVLGIGSWRALVVQEEVEDAFWRNESNFKKVQTVFTEEYNNTGIMYIKFVQGTVCLSVYKDITMTFTCDSTKRDDCSSHQSDFKPKQVCDGLRQGYELLRVAQFQPYMDKEKEIIIPGTYEIRSEREGIIFDWEINERDSLWWTRIMEEVLWVWLLSLLPFAGCIYSACSRTLEHSITEKSITQMQEQQWLSGGNRTNSDLSIVSDVSSMGDEYSEAKPASPASPASPALKS